MPMIKSARFQKYYIFSGALLFSILFLLIQIILVYLPIEPDIRTVLSDISSPLIGLLTTVGIFLAAIRTRNYSNPIARAWFFLGYAQIAYFLGDLTWGILEIGLKISPFPSIADIPYLLYYPLFFYAVMQFPSVKRQSYEWLKRLLDLVIIMIGGVMLYWNYILGPIIQIQTGVPLLSQGLAYSYPLGDLILFWAILILLYNRVHEKNGFPLLLIALGVTVMIISDCYFSIQSLNETYVAGGLLDVSYILQNLLVFLAAVWQFTSEKEFSKSNSPSSSIVVVINSFFSYLPYFWLLASIIMLINSYYQTLQMGFSHIAGATIILLALVFLRQIINNIQIRKLIVDVDVAFEKIDRDAREMHVATLHDFLTNLPNRALFMDRLDSALLSIKRHSYDPYAVLFLDLDNFKNVNDTKGHVTGDRLLIQIAQCLRNCLRETDTIARLGGDEFIMLLEDIGDLQSVINTTNRILEAFKNPFEIGDFKIYTSVSIGIVLNLKTYTNSTDVLRDADIALYKAKESGKSCYTIFDSHMRTIASKRVLIENELRHAIEYGQFNLVYQPIYSLIPEKVVGFEALIRWQNPTLGLVMPADFIPIAEENGLIIDIGDWVIFEACCQMKSWQNLQILPEKTYVNVNVSGLQFSQPDFMTKLKNILEKTKCDPATLKLEITESVLLDIQQRESDLFTGLKDLGVHLEIDDFGTGYSSLRYLQQIPVDVLKIDRSFVQEIGSEMKNKELVRAIVSMAQGMGMETTAEGIETLGQKEILTSLGCNNGQGYFWAKPMEPTAVEKFLGILETNLQPPADFVKPSNLSDRQDFPLT